MCLDTDFPRGGMESSMCKRNWIMCGLSAILICMSILTGCGMTDMFSYEEDPEDIDGYQEDYGWNCNRGYDQLEWTTADGATQILYTAVEENYVLLVYDRPSFEALTTFEIPAVNGANADIQTYEFSDIDGDGNEDYVATGCIDDKEYRFVFIYNSEANTFEYSEGYSGEQAK